jgi:hypothetical protein
MTVLKQVIGLDWQHLPCHSTLYLSEGVLLTSV